MNYKPQHSPELMAIRHEVMVRADQLGLEPVVLGDGRLDAEIVIVGQGPGHHEVDAKSPFVGPTGNVLWNTLRQHGILRTSCYVTNVCKRQYSIDKRSELGRDEWLKWFSVLQWELSQLKNPKYIFALGNAAIDGLLGITGITKYRGSVFPLSLTLADGRTVTVQVLCSYNPANVIRNPEDEIVFQMDAFKLTNLKNGDHEQWNVNTRYDMTFDEAMAEILRLKTENKPTSVDLELTSGELACVGLTNDFEGKFDEKGVRQFYATCINFRTQLENLYTRDEEIKLLFALQDLYESLAESDNLIVQNGAFDAGFSGIKDHMNMPVSYDTMLMHHTLYPSLPHNLGFLTSQYTPMPYYKDEFDQWKEEGDVTVLWRYNGRDCVATLVAFYKLLKELKEQRLINFYNDQVKFIQNHLIQGTVNGIKTDMAMRAKVAEELRIEVQNALDHFHALVHAALPDMPSTYNPNPDSWQQLKKLFYQYLGLRHKDQGTDADARELLIKDPRTTLETREILLAVGKYKTLQKFASTYVELRLDADNRFRCVWKQEGVSSAPGRLSSASTLWGTGGNGQNQPPAARQFFIADPGCCLVYFDLKQAEAVVVAYRADIQQWKEDFDRARRDDSFDSHRSLASTIFNVPYDEVPKSDRNEDDTDYTIRYVSKRARHGLNYRMQIERFAETAGISYSRAADVFAKYHRGTPEIMRWWREQERLVKNEREIFNAFGRRWKVLQRIDDDALIPMIAYYPQSTIGDKVARVWGQAEEDDRWDMHKGRIILDVHDALIGMCKIEWAQTALSIMKGYAEQPILIENVYRTKRDPVIIPADCAISTTLIRDRKTKQVIREDEYHRWSNLEKIKIEAARV